ncbi:hypothetical protein AB6A40_000618 [Gnathostoma spinigerum]|uniref:SEC7 domain-containing protein n=1 Tax=Gnathostoma spinigerum TaxID=75299 RepID=A0ABD6E960_9BILA
MAVNGLYIVQGESNAVVALLKKAHRWPRHQQHLYEQSILYEADPLLRNFTDLRDVLNSVNDLADMNPDTFLSPFLDVIRSEQTNGPVTAQALSSVAKFLSYGLIDSSSIKASNAVEKIADAVTHAKFVGSADPGHDEVVLLRILLTLRILLLTPVGRLLSNESVCEIMQSCFRICFEGALSELLRKAAEATLADMTQLIFTRLPTFKEDIRHPYIRKLVKRFGGLNGRKKRRRLASTTRNAVETKVGSLGKTERKDQVEICAKKSSALTKEGDVDIEKESGDIEVVPDIDIEDVDSSPNRKGGEFGLEEETRKSLDATLSESDQFHEENVAAEKQLPESVSELPFTQNSTTVVTSEVKENTMNERTQQTKSKKIQNFSTGRYPTDDGAAIGSDDSAISADESEDSSYVSSPPQRTRINERGIRFTPEGQSENRAALSREVTQKEHVIAKPVSHIPYGLPCARELLRFLIALTNPLDRANTESMILMGLNLLTVALEAGADYLCNYSLLMPLVKNELCRALLQLLDTEKLPVFAATSRVCFLLFEALRTSLKFQMESYFQKLKTIVTSESERVSYEQKEMALESLVQLWRIPGLVTELYLNYDCDLYCSNLFEDMTKLLLENAFPVLSLQSTHILSLDALLTVIDTIDVNCVYRQADALHAHISHSSSSSQLRLPVVSGYEFGKQIMSVNESSDGNTVPTEESVDENVPSALIESILPSSAVRANRMAPSLNIPSLSEVIERKKHKRIITEGTEMFNQDPKKGINFLMERGILKTPMDPEDVVAWLRANPHLDKKRIADYICSRKNSNVLEAFVRSFSFENVRLDDALRLFLETFRLPGEAAEISMVMQHFADHWYTANHEPFNHVDAAFTLAYAVIMLNTDQHNPQVRRNQPPMTVECFKRNLSGTNGGQDFDQDMLEQMFHAIRSDEIVMPAEQVGVIKENYLWKVLLRRGETKEGEFIHVPAGWNDHDLFAIIWGPATAALSYVFDKSDQETILQKSLNGYRKCASIAAHYGMSDVFDNLIIHLCKFSTLMTSTEGGAEQSLEAQRSGGLSEITPESIDQVSIAFGENIKAQMAAKAMFQLVHTHGDILRDGWKNILDAILHLFRAHLLPVTLTEVEDFVDPKGWVSIQRDLSKKATPNRSDSGLLSWFGLGTVSDARPPKLTCDQQQYIKIAKSVIAECHPEQLVIDGKYLTSSALSELITALVQASNAIVAHIDRTKSGLSLKRVPEEDEDALILYAELTVCIALENKDRLNLIWLPVKHHLEWLMTQFGKNPLVVERSVVGLLRLANRNLFRLKDEIAEEVLCSLSMLLKLRPPAMFMFSRQIAFGLHELLRANAANVHKKKHWTVLFALLEAVGAGSYPEDYPHRESITEIGETDIMNERQVQSDIEEVNDRNSTSGSVKKQAVPNLDRGYTSDDPGLHYGSLSTSAERFDTVGSLVHGSDSNEWIHLDHKDASLAAQQQQAQLRQSVASYPPSNIFDRGTVVLRANLVRHDPAAFLKVGETLAFLMRDAAHVTPENFESCVQCLRAFVEASLDGGRYSTGQLSREGITVLHSVTEKRLKQTDKSLPRKLTMNSRPKSDTEEDDSFESEQERMMTMYQQTAFQMLDICYTLLVKASGIYRSWAAGGANVDASAVAMWVQAWRPLLQCITRLCCDCRRKIRMQALNYLVRSFLIPDMHSMEAHEWENCFGEVLFPLIQKLLENLSPMDPLGMEETRVRAMQLLSKILLNHLTPLGSLPSFSALWIRLLDFMDRYLHTDRSDLLSEAVPESLKNMILVLDNTGMFRTVPDLYEITTTKVGAFLPALLEEVMPSPPLKTDSKVDSVSTSDNTNGSVNHTERSLPTSIAPSHATIVKSEGTDSAEEAPLVRSANTLIPTLSGSIHIARPLDEFRTDSAENKRRDAVSFAKNAEAVANSEDIARMEQQSTVPATGHELSSDNLQSERAAATSVEHHVRSQFQPSENLTASFSQRGEPQELAPTQCKSSEACPSTAAEDLVHTLPSYLTSQPVPELEGVIVHSLSVSPVQLQHSYAVPSNSVSVALNRCYSDGRVPPNMGSTAVDVMVDPSIFHSQLPHDLQRYPAPHSQTNLTFPGEKLLATTRVPCGLFKSSHDFRYDSHSGTSNQILPSPTSAFSPPSTTVPLNDPSISAQANVSFPGGAPNFQQARP